MLVFGGEVLMCWDGCVGCAVSDVSSAVLVWSCLKVLCLMLVS